MLMYRWWTGMKLLVTCMLVSMVGAPVDILRGLEVSFYLHGQKNAAQTSWATTQPF